MWWVIQKPFHPSLQFFISFSKVNHTPQTLNALYESYLLFLIHLSVLLFLVPCGRLLRAVKGINLIEEISIRCPWIIAFRTWNSFHLKELVTFLSILVVGIFNFSAETKFFIFMLGNFTKLILTEVTEKSIIICNFVMNFFAISFGENRWITFLIRDFDWSFRWSSLSNRFFVWQNRIDNYFKVNILFLRNLSIKSELWLNASCSIMIIDL